MPGQRADRLVRQGRLFRDDFSTISNYSNPCGLRFIGCLIPELSRQMKRFYILHPIPRGFTPGYFRLRTFGACFFLFLIYSIHKKQKPITNHELPITS